MADESQGFAVPPQQIERAVKLSYAQAMLGAIYGASVGGMFLIGYALRLGATDVQIGLMSTVPMLLVWVQLFAAAMVERGISRRLLTVVGALGNVLGWVVILLIPYLLRHSAPAVKIFALITIITVVTIFAYVQGNARGSWVGDLIPASYRGTFFGRLTMYGGIIGTAFALAEGRFLDALKHAARSDTDVTAFSWLFGFGILIGLVNAFLFMPQADVPLPQKAASSGSFMGYVKDFFTNAAFITVMVYALLWSMQAIAGPFYATYMLRDLQMPFLGVGFTNAMVTVTMLLSSPFWGRMVDRYGCRPILVLCTAALAPFPLLWLPIAPGPEHAKLVYFIIAPINLLGGFLIAGISVALSTLVYKVTPSAGRAVQFALYSIIVTLVAAPMPTIGGNLKDWISHLWPGADLRATFFASVPFILAAAVVARYIHEPTSRRTSELLRHLPLHLLKREVRDDAAGEAATEQALTALAAARVGDGEDDDHRA